MITGVGDVATAVAQELGDGWSALNANSYYENDPCWFLDGPDLSLVLELNGRLVTIRGCWPAELAPYRGSLDSMTSVAADESPAAIASVLRCGIIPEHARHLTVARDRKATQHDRGRERDRVLRETAAVLGPLRGVYGDGARLSAGTGMSSVDITVPTSDLLAELRVRAPADRVPVVAQAIVRVLAEGKKGPVSSKTRCLARSGWPYLRCTGSGWPGLHQGRHRWFGVLWWT